MDGSSKGLERVFLVYIFHTGDSQIINVRNFIFSTATNLKEVLNSTAHPVRSNSYELLAGTVNKKISRSIIQKNWTLTLIY